ncbi:MAG: hypothetical protein ABIQ70_13960 [Dokdonella sp.]
MNSTNALRALEPVAYDLPLELFEDGEDETATELARTLIAIWQFTSADSIPKCAAVEEASNLA